MVQRPCHRADGGLRQECKDPRLLQWSACEGAETLPLRLSMLLAPGEILGGLEGLTVMSCTGCVSGDEHYTDDPEVVQGAPLLGSGVRKRVMRSSVLSYGRW